MDYDVICLVDNPEIYPIINGKTTYYRCEGFVCKEPSNVLI